MSNLNTRSAKTTSNASAPYGKPKGNHYVPNRFNDLEYIGNPICNHKVEQFLRAVMYPEMVVSGGTNVNSMTYQVQTEQKPLDIVIIGIGDARGLRLHPETNTWLSRNGIKPNAVLFALGTIQVEGVSALVNQEDALLSIFAALVRVAYEAVFDTKGFNKRYEDAVKSRGVPKAFTVQGVYFDSSKLYEVV